MDYIYIRAWEKMMGAFSYYIEIQLQIAREENAPQDAIYKANDGAWQTFSDMKSEDAKQRVQEIVDYIRKG